MHDSTLHASSEMPLPPCESIIDCIFVQQVLNTVKCRIEDYLCKVQDLEVALSQAQQYLIFRMDPNFDPRRFSTSTLLPAPVGEFISITDSIKFSIKSICFLLNVTSGRRNLALYWSILLYHIIIIISTYYYILGLCLLV